jgi:hypothetical protein
MGMTILMTIIQKKIVNYSFFGGSVVFKGLSFGVPLGGSEFLSLDKGV